ncbi:inositol monophosphatase family protein [Sulfurospirillum arcachonense]|uniref:inositol monophosphatase family protein n=1 Tax=Sulfurospirillum arcachonense TaxID=57666 RepID=UPI000469FBE0|nr:inositol monophosphatase family protein [Sulfurospirillum arcachonense]
MQDFFDAVILANKDILELLNSDSDENFYQSCSLGAGGDISSKIDLLAEEIFIKYLSKFGNIYSEECGFVDNSKEDEIIIDPIDGSDNFASNLPYYGTSVALKRDNKCIAGIIVNLANGEIFIKDNCRFEKANLKNLQFKKVVKNQYSKLGLFERTYCSKSTPELMRKHHIKYRSPGAFALSLAYAHEVDFVLYEGKMRAYDIEAGLFMCEDLYVEKREDLLLVSKDKEIFGKISQFI